MKLDRVIAVRNNKTVFRDGKRCIKIFSPEFSKPAVFAEALNHTRVEECVDFAPRLLEVIRHDKNWAIVYEFIKGKTLLQWLEEESEALKDQVDFFVETQLKLQSLSCRSLSSMKDQFLSCISKLSIEEKQKQALLKKLKETKLSSALCHCDFVPSNVIITEDGSPFVIDWGSALSGEPAADAATTYLLTKIRGLDSFAELYRRVYVEKAQIDFPALDYWIPFAAAYLMSFANEAQRNSLLPYVNSIENKGV